MKALTFCIWQGKQAYASERSVKEDKPKDAARQMERSLPTTAKRRQVRRTESGLRGSEQPAFATGNKAMPQGYWHGLFAQPCRHRRLRGSHVVGI